MTVFLRLLSVASAYLALVLVSVSVGLFIFDLRTSPVRDTLALQIMTALTLLAVRCTGWLWRKKRFWTELRSFSEVCALGAMIAALPIVIALERSATQQLAEDVVHLSFVAVVLGVYFAARRYGRLGGIQP